MQSQKVFSFRSDNRRHGRAGSFLFSLFKLLIMALFAGCAFMPPAAPVPQLPSPDVQILWQKLIAAEKAPKAIKAVARIDIVTQSERYPLKTAILLQYPDSLRVESLPLFGPPDFYLVIENERLKVLLPQEGKYYVGSSSPKELAAFLPFISSRFQLADMFSLLRGTVPLIKDEDVILRGFPDKEFYRLEAYKGKQKRQALWLKPGSDQLVRATLWDRDGSILYTAQFEAYGYLKEAVDFPAKISVATGQSDPVIFNLNYTDLQFPQEIAEDLFSLKIPPGVEPLILNKE
ncbi:MAG: hypothetical protein A4E66_01007 [Syntrophus sp. PtaB.Bin001]|nr:MAG: hypothetical protein A4E66_01007 [Syntrophus sp. PtaB.Bin001]